MIVYRVVTARKSLLVLPVKAEWQAFRKHSRHGTAHLMAAQIFHAASAYKI